MIAHFGLSFTFKPTKLFHQLVYFIMSIKNTATEISLSFQSEKHFRLSSLLPGVPIHPAQSGTETHTCLTSPSIGGRLCDTGKHAWMVDKTLESLCSPVFQPGFHSHPPHAFMPAHRSICRPARPSTSLAVPLPLGHSALSSQGPSHSS